MTRRIENGADFRGPLLASGSAGTRGQVLTSSGPGAVPTWAAPYDANANLDYGLITGSVTGSADYGALF